MHAAQVLDHAQVLDNARALDTVADRQDRRSVAIAADEGLIRRTAAGDKAAMRALFTHHHVRVYRFVLRLVGNPALAEDLVSETLLDVWRQAGTFDARSAVTTWLLSIARFKALSALRRRSDEELDDKAATAVRDPADDPEVMIQKKDKSEILRACLAGLSRPHRDVIDLAYYHEKSIEEIAEIVRIPVNTVKTRMFYARNCLSALLTERGVLEA
jgi:RNA polymerase sigma-70 factor (ECF subfamily)